LNKDLREIKLDKNNIDVSSLPIEYQNKFLKKTIYADILEINISDVKYSEHDDIENKIIKLNKGSKDGVFEKLSFFTKNNNYKIEIYKVEETCSYGYFRYFMPSREMLILQEGINVKTEADKILFYKD
jgi:hypothetical protein